MDAIRILVKCAASGQHLPAGAVFKVPAQVSADDAGRLVRMRRAEVVVGKVAKAAKVVAEAPAEVAAAADPAAEPAEADAA